MQVHTAAPTPMVVSLRQDGWILAHVSGVARGDLAAFRQGKWRPQDAIDLHGVRASDVKPLLAGFVERARRRQHRAALVIFGRGLHSPYGGVLRDVTYDVVTEGKLPSVRAIASARPADGGIGAAYIWIETT